MPELIGKGPNIPAHLMNELDDGNVVFFCGAGVSAGQGSELPDFPELVKQVYGRNHMEPDEIESEALDLKNSNLDTIQLGRPNLDKALGLLEGRLGAQILRSTIIECLTVEQTGPLKTHEALIALSRTEEQGVRLITTNFDDRFIETELLKEHLIDTGPKLPIPKKHSWSTLVHLHGRIQHQDDGSNLVITEADYGRAYLTEAWAARFITEVFREFTVVFVGYSVSDPVMSYLVHALAAERSKGGRFTQAFAFADYDGTESNKQAKGER